MGATPGSETTSIKQLRGMITVDSRWDVLLGRAGWRVKPFRPGAMISADSSGVTVSINTPQGLASNLFQTNAYVMVARAMSEGPGYFYIPDRTLISRVSSMVNADIILSSALTVYKGDWLINLGNDSANPTSSVEPAYDGSSVDLYNDPAGDEDNTDGYILTMRGGYFNTWITAPDFTPDIVDLLLWDTDQTLRFVHPLWRVEEGF